MYFTSIRNIISTVAHAACFYNNRHPHMSIYMMTPSIAALYEGEMTTYSNEYHIGNQIKTAASQRAVTCTMLSRVTARI